MLTGSVDFDLRHLGEGGGGEEVQIGPPLSLLHGGAGHHQRTVGREVATHLTAHSYQQRLGERREERRGWEGEGEKMEKRGWGEEVGEEGGQSVERGEVGQSVERGEGRGWEEEREGRGGRVMGRGERGERRGEKVEARGRGEGEGKGGREDREGRAGEGRARGVSYHRQQCVESPPFSERLGQLPHVPQFEPSVGRSTCQHV